MSFARPLNRHDRMGRQQHGISATRVIGVKSFSTSVAQFRVQRRVDRVRRADIAYRVASAAHARFRLRADIGAPPGRLF